MKGNEFAPPPEVWAHWLNKLLEENPDAGTEHICQVMVEKASQYGADLEFECCESWLPSDFSIDGESLRDVRRPDPRQSALDSLSCIENLFKELKNRVKFPEVPLAVLAVGEHLEIIRHVLENEPELQSRQDAATETYKMLYGGKESVEDRDRLCRETREKYGGLW